LEQGFRAVLVGLAFLGSIITGVALHIGEVQASSGTGDTLTTGCVCILGLLLISGALAWLRKVSVPLGCLIGAGCFFLVILIAAI
jgi:hypothetical protein